MRMNHPLWPVVRESARRIVRNKIISIHSSVNFYDEIIELSDIISEKIPERISFPTFVNSNNNDVRVYSKQENATTQIVQIGGFEPSEKICWINLDLKDGFDALMESCIQLLEAGYPGCVGCDNSAQEERWDEKYFRQLVKNG